MESTLAIPKAELEREVAIFLGYSTVAASRTSSQNDRIASYVKQGLAQFYRPDPMEPGGTSYEWSFLRPTASLTLESGKQTILLPDDFGGLDGDIVVLQTSGTHQPIRVVGEGYLRKCYGQSPDQTGSPMAAALSWRKGTTADRSQRCDLLVFPEADAAYTLQFRYTLLPNALTDDRPYAYGGAAHADTIRASCIAAAELGQDEVMGVRHENFLRRLAMSISIDRKFKPVVHGYNGDDSDGFVRRQGDRVGFPTATYEGTAY